MGVAATYAVQSQQEGYARRENTARCHSYTVLSKCIISTGESWGVESFRLHPVTGTAV